MLLRAIVDKLKNKLRMFKIKRYWLLLVLLLGLATYTYLYKTTCRYTLSLPAFVMSEYYKYTGNYSSLGKIDKIYVINLDKTPERYEHMKKILDKMDLPIEYLRFQAVDGKKSKIINKLTGESFTGAELASNKKLLNGEYDIVCADDFHDNVAPINIDDSTFSKKRKVGEIGCFCSHRKVWTDIIKNGYENVLVLEDDIFFIDHFKERLAMVMERVPTDYDLIYLGWWGDRSKCDINFKDLFIAKLITPIYSTEAYIVTSNAAKKLLENTRLHKQVDEEMADLIEKGALVAYTVKVKLTHQVKKIESVINAG